MINPKGSEEVGVFQSNLTIFDSCGLKKKMLCPREKLNDIGKLWININEHFLDVLYYCVAMLVKHMLCAVLTILSLVFCAGVWELMK